MSVKPKSASPDAHDPIAAPANVMLSLSVAPMAFAAAGALSTLGWAAFWAGAAAQMTRTGFAGMTMPMTAWGAAGTTAPTRSTRPQLTAIQGGAGAATAPSHAADVLPFPASGSVAPAAQAVVEAAPVATLDPAPVIEAPVEVQPHDQAAVETPVEAASPSVEAAAGPVEAEVVVENEVAAEAEGVAVAEVGVVAEVEAEAEAEAEAEPASALMDPAAAPITAEPVVYVVEPVVPAADLAADAPVEPVVAVEAPVAETAPSPADAPASTAETADPVAASTRPKGIYAPRGGVADNLKQISGIGPKIEKVLNELGFFHFEQIASWTAAEVEWVDSYLNFKGRVARDRWQAQADALAVGGAAEYLKRFGKEPR